MSNSIYVDYRYTHINCYRHSIIIVIHDYNQFLHLYFEWTHNETPFLKLNTNNKYLINEKWSEIILILNDKNIPEIILNSLKNLIY